MAATQGEKLAVGTPNQFKSRSGSRAVRPAFPPPSSKRVHGLASPSVSSAEVIARHPSARPITYTHETVVVGDDAERLWELYAAALGPIDEVAAMLHLEEREVVDSVFEAPGVTKIIARMGSEPVGLGLITNQLELISGISPSFFENRFPEHAVDDRIFYVSAVLVDPDRRGRTVFSRLLNELGYVAAAVGGVMIFDTCSFNRDEHRIDLVVQRIVDRFPRSTWQIVDQQTWYAAELPDPLDDRS